MDLVHSLLGNVYCTTRQLPCLRYHQVPEPGKAETPNSEGVSPENCSDMVHAEQSTCLTMGNFRITWQIREQLLYLKFYCPLKWVFGQSPECLCFAGLSTPHSGLNASPLKARKQCLSVHGHCYLHHPLIWALSRQQIFLAWLKIL